WGYTPIAVLSIFLVIRYALQRDAGWLFMALFSLTRIAGGALIVAGELIKNPSADLFLAAYIMFHAGLALLMLSTLGFLGLAGQHTYSEYLHMTRMFRVHIAPTKGHIGDILRKTSAALYGALYLLLFWVHLRCWSDRYELRSYRRKLLGGVIFALPVLGVRVAYEILAAWSSTDLFGLELSSNPTLAMFQPITGKWITYAIMGIVCEFVVAVLYMLSSTILARRRR
ncbi:hypothetical protein B0H10DRAFT_2104040, partial [Mycena sp. CBHHK59/15]